mmetsp:Transcript_20912/g.34463  ORF Transcript_20912/g.34463 Transcript_20912/m.34463 type:complete len:584 (-) Transcript_20912:302-2053(-)|eukprot:CAMPEP_0184658502 /NCGR_PEP_ID=MMETSP0308-20130426/25659_1 /TAXON_ID=38269 /ORGANISM="Gloeochaete witrockiana, Strain SAG 46.84" /LENGTH=583 /DNA_ID=CAMNT_0027097525 /DNA_START=1 /DNA_END=1752 /DNA_ORIENTATION=+
MSTASRRKLKTGPKGSPLRDRPYTESSEDDSETPEKRGKYLPSWVSPPSLPVFSIKDLSAVYIVILVVLAFYTRYRKLSQPDEVVFDEVHFGGFTNHYLRGEYFFDIHPPLGKLLIALAAKIAKPNYDGKFDFGKIHNHFDDEVPYVAMRFLPATACALQVVVMYMVSRQMGLSSNVALAAASGVLFETSILAQGRLILLDSFLLLFITCTAWANLKLSEYGVNPKVKGSETFWVVVTGIFAGCAASIKWTALAAVGGVVFHQGLLFLVSIVTLPLDFIQTRRIKGNKLKTEFKWKTFVRHPCYNIVARTAFILAVAGIVYIVFQWAHFKILYRMGDSFFMDFHTEGFRATIQGDVKKPRAGIRPSGFWSKVTELTTTMFSANKGILQTHPYQSKFWGWPIGQGGMWYWGKGNPDGSQTNILITANTAIYYTTTAFVFLIYPIAAVSSILYMIQIYLTDESSTKSKGVTERLRSFLFLGTVTYVTYVGNMLPYIGVARSTYAYHYFPALFCAIILTALTIEYVLYASPYYKTLVAFAFVAAGAYVYSIIMPEIYGDPISADRHQYIMDNFYWTGGPEQKLPWS